MTTFDSFLRADIKYARSLYDDEIGGVLVLRLDSSYSTPQSATALVLEHRPIESRQHTFSVRAGAAVPHRLAAGSYTLVVTADGYQPFRSHLEIVADQVVEIVAALEKVHQCGDPVLRDIAERYGISSNGPGVRELAVEPEKSIVLDSRSQDFAENRHVVSVTTVQEAKNVFGIPDVRWPGGAPRFGSQYPAEPSRADKGLSTPAARAALREYIFGNSRSVAAWTNRLNDAFEPFLVPFFAFENIDVGPKAVLFLDGTGLLCNKMSVHLTGRVIVTGASPTRVEMNTYQLYGLLTQTPSHGGVNTNP